MIYVIRFLSAAKLQSDPHPRTFGLYKFSQHTLYSKTVVLLYKNHSDSINKVEALKV